MNKIQIWIWNLWPSPMLKATAHSKFIKIVTKWRKSTSKNLICKCVKRTTLITMILILRVGQKHRWEQAEKLASILTLEDHQLLLAPKLQISKTNAQTLQNLIKPQRLTNSYPYSIGRAVRDLWTSPTLWTAIFQLSSTHRRWCRAGMAWILRYSVRTNNKINHKISNFIKLRRIKHLKFIILWEARLGANLFLVVDTLLQSP